MHTYRKYQPKNVLSENSAASLEPKQIFYKALLYHGKENSARNSHGLDPNRIMRITQLSILKK